MRPSLSVTCAGLDHSQGHLRSALSGRGASDQLLHSATVHDHVRVSRVCDARKTTSSMRRGMKPIGIGESFRHSSRRARTWRPRTGFAEQFFDELHFWQDATRRYRRGRFLAAGRGLSVADGGRPAVCGHAGSSLDVRRSGDQSHGHRDDQLDGHRDDPGLARVRCGPVAGSACRSLVSRVSPGRTPATGSTFARCRTTP